MRFKKIVANLAFSPSLLWHLNLYDKKNNQEIKRTKWLLCWLFLFTSLIIFFVFYRPPEHQQFDDFSLNIMRNQNIIDRKIIIKAIKESPHRKLFDYLKIDLTKISKIEKIDNINSNDLIIINHDNLNGQPNHLFDNYFYQPMPNNFSVKAFKISLENNFFYLLEDGNISCNFNNVVKNNRYNNVIFDIDVKNTTSIKRSFLENNDNAKVTININNKSKKELDNLSINLNDFFEYTDLVSNQKTENNIFTLPKIPANSKKTFELLFKAKSNFKTFDPIFKNKNDCVASIAVNEYRADIPVECPLFKLIDNKLGKDSTNIDLPNLLIVSVFFSIIIVIKLLYLLRLIFIKKELRKIRHNLNRGIL